MHFPDLLAIKYVHFCLSIKVNFFSFSLLTQDVMWMKKRFQNRQLWVCEIIERVPNLMVLVCSKPKNFLRRPAMVTEIEWTCWTLYAPFKNVLARPLNFKKILTSFYHTLWLLPLILFSDFNHTLIYWNNSVYSFRYFDDFKDKYRKYWPFFNFKWIVLIN